MGSQSLIHPHRFISNLFWIALLFLFSSPALPQTAATTVPLVLPSAVVYDSAGNLYIAETSNHLIRKVDVAGQITSIVGTGTQGFSGDGGLATSAQLDSPQGLALDSSGNLYIADTHNHRIRKLNLTTGIITTIAGSEAPGYSGDASSATTARLNLPTALTLDLANNLYFADTGNHRIRRIDASTGIITTAAGNGTQGYTGDNGPAVSASIDSPQGLAFDSANNLYLADTHNHRIRRIAISTGIITTIAGTGASGYTGDDVPALAAALSLPQGLTIDSSGNLYLADTRNYRVRRIDATTGVISTVVGTGTQSYTGDNGPAIAASIDSPHNTTLSPTGLLTFSDTANQRVRQLAAAPAPTTTIQTIAGIATTLGPASLTLTAPPTLTYGTGSISASLSTSNAVSGLITFINNATVLGTASLTANIATFDTSTLPAGTYNIIATYPGDLTHATTQSAVLTLTIFPAPTVITLTNSVATTTVTFTCHVSSAVASAPSGTVTLLDGVTPIQTSPISPTGDVSFTSSALTQGAHTITAIYNGAANFAPSASSPNVITIGSGGSAPAPDFTLNTTGAATQTIVAGSSATYTFTVQTSGNLASPINLAATGLPSLATASFNPAYLPPGSTTTFTLTIATPATTAKEQSSASPVLWAFLILPTTVLVLRRPRNAPILIVVTIGTFALLFCTGCGDRINSAAQSSTTTKNYIITVTGTATTASSTTLQHTATVSLNLINPN